MRMMGVLLDLTPPATVTDPLSHTTTFGYDPKGNPTTITNALNKITTITVNGQGQPLTIKDPLNNQTTFTYELGDLISVKDPLNRETKRMLDAAGRLRSIINPLGQKTIYTPDALDRITQLTDVSNGVEDFDADVEYLHIGGTLPFGGWEHAQPYFAAGLGATRFSASIPDADDSTRFSGSMAFGLEIPLAEHAAMTFAVSGAVALMLQQNPGLTPPLIKAILQYTAEQRPGYNALRQGAGFLNTLGAVRLSRYFHNAQKGDAYPNMRTWSRHILWGNNRVRGGVLTPGGTAWGLNIVWGDALTPAGQNIVWGENCDNAACDNIVWGNNIVWGESDADDNIVWRTTWTSQDRFN